MWLICEKTLKKFLRHYKWLHSANFYNIMGRPATKQARLKDGFYIELKSQGSGSIFVRRDTEEQMNIAAAQYSKMKNVIIKGEMKNDKWVTA